MKLLNDSVEKGDLVPIGKIVGVHGLAGNLKIDSYAESLEIFETGRILQVRNRNGEQKAFSINWIKPHPRAALLSLKQINSRTEAEALVGCRLFIEKASLPALEEGSHYWFDIIGLSVFTAEEEYLGRVVAVMQTGSNDVYVVRDSAEGGPKETLIPALASVVVSIDLEQKTMQVVLPEGLI